MHCKQWIFDMDGTLTDSMVVVWEGAPEALLARFGRTPKADLHETLLTMGMEEGAQYLIREYALPLDRNGYLDVMREVIAQLYEKVELSGGHSGHHQRCRRPRFAPHLRPVPAGLDCTGLGAGVRFHKTATVRRSCNPGAAGV